MVTWHHALPAAAALLAVTGLTPLVVRTARWRGWMAEPTEDRWHRRPTALMGGIAIFAAVTAGWLAQEWLVPGVGPPWVVWAGAAALFATGVVDDLRGLDPVAKVVVQVAAAALLLVAGFELLTGWTFWLSVPLTFLWVVGITNAVNLLDNMDGLAAGVVAIGALALAAVGWMAGDAPALTVALAVAATAAGFLLYNFQPARIFMGDCGSLVLGYLLAALALDVPVGAGASGLLALLVVPAAVMAVPILDTTLVTVQRLLSGLRVSDGGRDHASHRLVALGLSERRAVLTLYAVTAAFGALAVAFYRFEVTLGWAVAAFAAVGLGIFGVLLANVKVYGPEEETLYQQRSRGRNGGDHVVLRAALRNKKRVGGVIADLVLMTAAFVVAYHLRFEGGMTEEVFEAMVRALPVVVGLKVLTFYAFGMYRGIWRYAGTHEVLRAVKASTAASVVCVALLAMLYRFEGYSRSVFVIDWLLTTVAVVGLRTGYRALWGYLAAKRARGKRVLLYGAGAAGSLALREIRQNLELDLVAVGFVDDDPEKEGSTVEGLTVLGPGSRLAELADRHRIDEVLVTIGDLPKRSRTRVAGQCAAAGVPTRHLRVGFVPERTLAGLEGDERLDDRGAAAPSPRYTAVDAS